MVEMFCSSLFLYPSWQPFLLFTASGSITADVKSKAELPCNLQLPCCHAIHSHSAYSSWQCLLVYAAAGSSASAVKSKAELHLTARRPAERLLRAWGGTDRLTLEHTKESITKCLQACFCHFFLNLVFFNFLIGLLCKAYPRWLS